MYLFRRTLAAMAVGVDVNPLAGQLIERLPIAGYLEIGVNSSVGGAINFDVLINGRQLALADIADTGAVPPDPRVLPIQNALVYYADRGGQLTFTLHATAIATPSVHVRLAQYPRNN